MDTATQPGAPSASASVARADGTSAVTATEHDHHMDSATELALPPPVLPLREPMALDPMDDIPFLYSLYYELMQFFSEVLRDVCRASAPHWFSLDQECDMMVHEFFDVWHHKKATHYLPLFSQP